MFNRGLRSSASDEWETPDWLFDLLFEAFRFTLDAAATPVNARLPRYFSKSSDRLSVDWVDEDGQPAVAFVSPPHGRQIPRWMAKAVEQANKGALVVMLTTYRPDTWWNRYAVFADEIWSIVGRLRFRGAAGSAPMPSTVLVFRPRVRGLTYDGPRHARLFRHSMRDQCDFVDWKS